jgi:hypothetical protein
MNSLFHRYGASSTSPTTSSSMRWRTWRAAEVRAPTIARLERFLEVLPRWTTLAQRPVVARRSCR